MTSQIVLSARRAVSVAVLALAACPSVLAKDTIATAWVKDEQSLDRSAQIYLNPAFTPIKGKFKAVPESVMDRKDTIEGSFLVGEYRYVFNKPERDKDGKLSDELISTEVLDCNKQFYGTLKQVRKYKGKVISESGRPAASVEMIQTSSPNIGTKLCALFENKKVARLVQAPVTNASYNPKPTQQDVDKIIDKYAPPKPKNQQ